MFDLRLLPSEITKYAKRYEVSDLESKIIALRSQIHESKKIPIDDLFDICRWKSPRKAKNVKTNSQSFIDAITEFALTTRDERSRIESLTLLNGVSWGTASVILHLYHNERYPILDFRALWSLKVGEPIQYDFDFWVKYTTYCRNLSDRLSLDMRTLDKGLWQYSKEHQPKRST
jgi:hypothetical protein